MFCRWQKGTMVCFWPPMSMCLMCVAVCVPLHFLRLVQLGGGGGAMDGLWTEARGQQRQSNDPGNNQHILNAPTIGRR